MPRQESIHISKHCTSCGKRGTSAVKVSDFWIVYCDDCKGKTVTLNTATMKRICSEDGTFR